MKQSYLVGVLVVIVALAVWELFLRDMLSGIAKK
jgi:hypothetical protein